MADGAVDMYSNIQFGRPFPVRSFPDFEAAKAYVLSGLDRARLHLLGHEHLHRVADGIRDVRLFVAGDRVPAAMAASVELRALAAEARQMQARQVQMRRALRLTVILSLFAGSLAVAFSPALGAITPLSLAVMLLSRDTGHEGVETDVSDEESGSELPEFDTEEGTSTEAGMESEGRPKRVTREPARFHDFIR